MKTNLILLAITILSVGYLSSLFIRAILIPAWKEYQYKKKENDHLEKGLRPFFYEHGRIKVFAKSQEQADAEYKELKKKLKKFKTSKN